MVVSASPLTRARLQELAFELVSAGPLEVVGCAGCGQPPTLKTRDGALLCGECVTPFDR